METGKQQTKKQHYLPQFYLKQFADSKKNVAVLDVKNKRMGKTYHYSAVGYKSYFYAVDTGIEDETSQQIEEWLQSIENIIADELPKIIQKILTQMHIDEKEKYILSALMSLLWMRTPGMREHLNKMHEDIRKKVMSLYASQRIDQYLQKTKTQVSEEERTHLVSILKNGSYDLRFNNVNHLQFLTQNLGVDGPGFTNMFFGQKWKLHIANGEKKFITTDNPVVEWWLPRKIIYGPTFLERNKYFALTPNILIELTTPLGSTKAKRKTYFRGDDDEVSIYNMLLVSHTHQFAYSGDKEILKRLLTGMSQPGILERDYHRRFQLPWIIDRKSKKIITGSK